MFPGDANPSRELGIEIIGCAEATPPDTGSNRSPEHDGSAGAAVAVADFEGGEEEVPLRGVV